MGECQQAVTNLCPKEERDWARAREGKEGGIKVLYLSDVRQRGEGKLRKVIIQRSGTLWRTRLTCFPNLFIDKKESERLR